MSLEIFEEMESKVRSYCRSFPVVFDKAKGPFIYDKKGNEYIDFLAGAGTLNYGHNNDLFKRALIDYIQQDGITHGLDMSSKAKQEFLEVFRDNILGPRGLDYVLQFTGPTGANSVEAALKMARHVKGRKNVIAFTNGFHGVTTAALAATGNSRHRNIAGMCLDGITRFPYDGYMDGGIDTLAYMQEMLNDSSSGLDHPAAVIVEGVQGEGGLNAARLEWLRKLQHICCDHNMLLVYDDIQAGCGRTGTFFSFEPAGIKPDIITLSKSLSGYGLPFAVTLYKPEIDQWKPGEHNGTFRGNNHAFVTATAALKHYWADDKFARDIRRKSQLIAGRIDGIIGAHPHAGLKHKGRGMMQGIDVKNGETANQITRMAFGHGLIVETSGPEGEVVKCLCPLTIDDATLMKGWDIIEECFAAVIGNRGDLKKAA